MSSGSYCYLKRSMIKSTCTLSLSLSLSLSINFSRTLTRIFILISVTPPSSSVWALLAFHQTNTISVTFTHTSQYVYTHKVYLFLSFSHTHINRDYITSCLFHLQKLSYELRLCFPFNKSHYLGFYSRQNVWKVVSFVVELETRPFQDSFWLT